MKKDRQDLIVLVADTDMKYALHALLDRHKEFGCREIEAQIRRHEQRDPGCFNDGHNFLRPFCTRYEHALVILDKAFDKKAKQAKRGRQALEQTIEGNLSRNGWKDRAAAVVIDPELEIWVWSTSPELDECLGWTNREPDLRTWLRDQKLWPVQNEKPPDPKQAMHDAMKKVGKAVSARIFGQLAKTVAFQECRDSSFLKLLECLGKWFPER